MKLLDGAARKVSIPFVILAIFGWIIFVVGFALFNNEHPFREALAVFVRLPPSEHSAHIDYFPFWCFIVTGAFLFPLTIVHLIVGQWFTGIFTHFLTALYLVMGGCLLYFLGLPLWQDFDADAVNNANGLLYILVMWVGSAISALNITIYMLLWPLFTNPQRGDPESDVQVAPTPTHTRDPVTYRAPYPTGETKLEPPPEYPAGSDAWAEMKSPVS